MREDSRRRYRSSSRGRDSERRIERSHKPSKKSKKTKKSKKYSRRSPSSSSSSSYESRESQYHHSRRSSTRALSAESNSRISKTRPSSSENSRTATTVHTKEIDLADSQVQIALSTIEEEKFEAKTFFSTRDREAPNTKLANEKVIIDLKSETVQLPKPLEKLEITKEQIFHPNFMGDPELKTEKWLRKLYNFRRKHFED